MVGRWKLRYVVKLVEFRCLQTGIGLSEKFLSFHKVIIDEQ